MKLLNKVVVLTGAGSGIGRALAIGLASRGCHLALVDVNASNLLETKQQISDPAILVSTHHLDVTDKEAIAQLLADVQTHHKAVDILINNAGVGADGTFLQITPKNFDRVMAVNFEAVVGLTRAFLPHLLTRPEARIVNLSSLFGIVTPPEQTAYAASKFAVRGFSNSLRFELAATNVGITVVHPGGVNTSISYHAPPPEGVSPEEVQQQKEEQQKLLRMPPQKAAAIIIKGIAKNKSRILVGFDAKAIALLERLLPVNYWKVMGKLIAIRKKL